jgi:hypothetical protein
MSFRNWLQRLRDRCVWAVFALLMGFVLGASLFSEQNQERGNAAKRGQTEQHQANQARFPPTTQPTDPVVTLPEDQKAHAPKYDPVCNDPKDREDANLCEQRRMSKAAEESVGLARIQAWIAAFGVVLVGLSVAFAGWAAWAASQSAEAAAKSVDISLKSVKLSQGAILDFKVDTATLSENSFNMTSKVQNVGKSVATIEAIRMRYHIGADLPDVPNYTDSAGRYHGTILAPGDAMIFDEDPERQTELSESQMTEILTGRTNYFFYGRITYRDALGSIFDRGFAYQVEPEKVADDKFRFRFVLPINATTSTNYNFLTERGPDFAEPALNFIFLIRKYSVVDGCKIDLRLVNTGKSELVVQDVSLKYLHVAALPDTPDYGPKNKWRNKRERDLKMIPGQVAMISPEPIALDEQTFQDVLAGERTTFVFGQVRYRSGSDVYEADYARRIVVYPQRKADGTKVYRFRAETPPNLGQYNFFRQKRPVFSLRNLLGKEKEPATKQNPLGASAT